MSNLPLFNFEHTNKKRAMKLSVGPTFVTLVAVVLLALLATTGRLPTAEFSALLKLMARTWPF